MNWFYVTLLKSKEIASHIMNTSVFLPCSCCGALGAVGHVCSFCGNTIQGNSDILSRPSLIAPIRTISDEEYISKTSKYTWVDRFSEYDLAIVYAGGLFGVINRDADLVVPLDYDKIEFIDELILLERKNKRCALNILHWVFIKRGNEDSDIWGIQIGRKNNSGQRWIYFGSTLYIYDAANDKCVCVGNIKYVDELGCGFAIVKERENSGYIDYNVNLTGYDSAPFSGYILGDGTILFKDKLFFKSHDTYGDCVKLKSISGKEIDFNLNSDPIPQFQELFAPHSRGKDKGGLPWHFYLFIVVFIASIILKFFM